MSLEEYAAKMSNAFRVFGISRGSRPVTEFGVSFVDEKTNVIYQPVFRGDLADSLEAVRILNLAKAEKELAALQQAGATLLQTIADNESLWKVTDLIAFVDTHKMRLCSKDAWFAERINTELRAIVAEYKGRRGEL